MREILIIGLLAATLIGAWFLISSTTVTNNNTGVVLSEREQIHAFEMSQLVNLYSDTPMQPHLPNHKFIHLDDGTGMFLHFNTAYGNDQTLNWIGTFVPGRFCKAEQERVEATYGPGFTHFHKETTPGTDPTAGHGGVGNEEGYWFRHIAVRDIEQGDPNETNGMAFPWGPISPGIDYNFMPTTPPEC